MSIHQKSESCHCGAWLNAEGDEGTVLAACEGFRVMHRQYHGLVRRSPRHDRIERGDE